MKSVFKVIIICFLIFTNGFSNDIKIGMSSDFSGPIAYIGNNMKKGVQTYFNSYNKTSNNKLILIAKDDKYNPLLTSKNIKELIELDDVVAFIGNTGTPTTNVIIPLLNENNIVLFAPYSGGDNLRNNLLNRNIFNYRASYLNEAYFIVSNILKNGIKPQEIAFFYQNDTFGDSGYFGALKAIEDFGYKNAKMLVNGRYKKATVNVEDAVSKLYDSKTKIKVILLISVNQAAIKYINLVNEDFKDIIFFALSPLDISIVSKKINKNNKLYVTQVVPLLDSKVKIVEEFNKNFKESFPNDKANLINLEGYIAAKLFTNSIKDFNNITSKQIFKKLNNLSKVDIGLEKQSSFNIYTHQYSNSVWLSTFKDGKIVNIDFAKVFKEK